MPELSDLNSLKVCLRQQGKLADLLAPADFAPEGLVADHLARDFKDKLNATQMRKVFHTIKRIERGLKGKLKEQPLGAEERSEISLLSPSLAYAVGRELLPKDFYDLMKTCLASDKMQTVEDFRRLTQLLTAILAYQKYHSKSK